MQLSSDSDSGVLSGGHGEDRVADISSARKYVHSIPKELTYVHLPLLQLLSDSELWRAVMTVNSAKNSC